MYRFFSPIFLTSLIAVANCLDFEISPKLREECFQKCTKTDVKSKEVCGSDGQTYASKCEFEGVICVTKKLTKKPPTQRLKLIAIAIVSLYALVFMNE